MSNIFLYILILSIYNCREGFPTTSCSVRSGLHSGALKMYFNLTPFKRNTINESMTILDIGFVHFLHKKHVKENLSSERENWDEIVRGPDSNLCSDRRIEILEKRDKQHKNMYLRVVALKIHVANDLTHMKERYRERETKAERQTDGVRVKILWESRQQTACWTPTIKTTGGHR